MSNTFDNRIWILDTASTTALLLGVDSQISIQKIIFKPGAGAQTLTFKDKNAKVKYTVVSVTATPVGDIVENFLDKPLVCDGLILHTLTGGTVYVYLA